MTPPLVHVAPRSSGPEALTCAFCRDSLGEPVRTCVRDGCGAWYHSDCWAECLARYGGCAVYGCRSTDASDARAELRVREILRGAGRVASSLTFDDDSLLPLTRPCLFWAAFLATLLTQFSTILAIGAVLVTVGGSGPLLGLGASGLAALAGILLLRYAIPFTVAFAFAAGAEGAGGIGGLWGHETFPRALQTRFNSAGSHAKHGPAAS